MQNAQPGRTPVRAVLLRAVVAFSNGQTTVYDDAGGRRAMILNLDPELELELQEQARHEGIAPEQLALHYLQERLRLAANLKPRDEWERRLLDMARPWGISFSNEALSSEGLYD
jgi:hypothetical protein